MADHPTTETVKARIHLEMDTIHGGETHDTLEDLLDDLVAAAIAQHTAAPPPTIA
ncbi:hypothetical protein ABZ605_28225 [Streptomyces sp. NPDC012765]|uniref:hypothetical protein n=1 Tax=Streptomyces sp. NPDC012765 TaxID=3155249 RepID=UPI0033E19971